PDGLTDDAKPGIDLSIDTVNAIADYIRLVAIPRRAEPTTEGKAAFARAKCNVCHAPALRTRADHPMPVLAATDAAVFTDFLLHDMGDGLMDGVRDGAAGPRDWRTAPLIGLRFLRVFLHDGRATSIESAILLHDSPG